MIATGISYALQPGKIFSSDTHILLSPSLTTLKNTIMKKIITPLLALTLLSGFIFSPVSAAVLSEPVPASKTTDPGDEKINQAFKEFTNLSKKKEKKESGKRNTRSNK